jgi:hypothetical protein
VQVQVQVSLVKAGAGGAAWRRERGDDVKVKATAHRHATARAGGGVDLGGGGHRGGEWMSGRESGGTYHGQRPDGTNWIAHSATTTRLGAGVTYRAGVRHVGWWRGRGQRASCAADGRAPDRGCTAGVVVQPWAPGKTREGAWNVPGCAVHCRGACVTTAGLAGEAVGQGKARRAR